MGWGLPTGRVRNTVAGRGKSQELTVRADPAAVAPGGPTPAYENETGAPTTPAGLAAPASDRGSVPGHL